MRLFIAIPVPEEVRSELALWLASLSREIRDPERRLHWVKKEQFHLTLKFLGETREDQLPRLDQALRSAAQHTSSFPISLSKVGHFGGRVVWLGVNSGIEKIIPLAKEIDKACGSLGFELENRPFQPHLTLARSKINPGTIHLKNLPSPVIERTFGPFPVTNVTLVQSNLTPSGAIYREICHYPLIT